MYGSTVLRKTSSCVDFIGNSAFLQHSCTIIVDRYRYDADLDTGPTSSFKHVEKSE
jgi:hypothetical protein